ncbi:TPA: ureidoglycolate dehydrogenase [Providencia alcalifaciens]
MKVSKEKLHQLIANKIHAAGLSKDHADIVSDVLVHADAKGIHSHGAVRVEYYAERISKGGTNNSPNFTFKKTGPCSAVFDGDNGAGHVAAKLSMDEAIKMAEENGIAVVGVRRIGHSGSLSYFVQQASSAGMIGISVCQSDPMVVPYGGAETYYGTNPLAFSAPGETDNITFDMATTVQAWGKVLDARSKNAKIPDTWAVDKDGNPTTDPFAVTALVPIAGPKGYGLMMMVDILSGVLLGLPFGKHVSSMYHDLTQGRELGQLHIVINPAYFTDPVMFRKHITQVMNELNAVKPAPGFDKVQFPGQNSLAREKQSEVNGIDIVDEIYDYLVSDDIYQKSYDNKSPFAS